jgi:hypothetical protein
LCTVSLTASSPRGASQRRDETMTTSKDIKDYSADELIAMFEYLDELRESGATNMFGAGPYLASEFSMSRDNSHVVLKAWMNSYSDSLPADDRALNVLDAA